MVLEVLLQTNNRIMNLVLEYQRQQEALDSDMDDDDALLLHEKKNKMVSVMTPSPPSIYDTVEASVKYKSYVQRQHKDMESWRKAQGMRIPPDLVYTLDIFPTFSSEEIEKLATVQPTTFAEASAISGVTPQSLVYLYHHVTKRNKSRDRRSSTNKGGGSNNNNNNRKSPTTTTSATAAQ